ncbi:hypothetical protein GTP81_25250 [Rugamonas sp. FT107W]|uniref:Uncharacterized protein n=1 Tax=Duganella vulcania TaxID=2692166 RepID=A0A845HL30_9BURK|nr:hypothetical protein [Duganella vulcania]MYN20052.1 hypothetical protein [Duganella vulcania]
MNELRDRILVKDIAGNTAILQCNNPELVKKIEVLGFSSTGMNYSRKISGMDDRRDIVKKFVALGALFTAGRDWSTAEVVALFWKRELLLKSFSPLLGKGRVTFQ